MEDLKNTIGEYELKVIERNNNNKEEQMFLARIKNRV